MLGGVGGIPEFHKRASLVAGLLFLGGTDSFISHTIERNMQKKKPFTLNKADGEETGEDEEG